LNALCRRQSIVAAQLAEKEQTLSRLGVAADAAELRKALTAKAADADTLDRSATTAAADQEAAEKEAVLLERKQTAAAGRVKTLGKDVHKIELAVSADDGTCRGLTGQLAANWQAKARRA